LCRKKRDHVTGQTGGRSIGEIIIKHLDKERKEKEEEGGKEQPHERGGSGEGMRRRRLPCTYL
jgi:hypothetical protein